MSRLYYERGKVARPDIPEGSFRLEIEDHSAVAKQYLEKIAKLVPSEVLAAYLALIGIIPSVKYSSAHRPLYALSFILCAVLTPVYFNFQSETGRPRVYHLVLSTLAFVVWAYVTSAARILPNYYDPALSSIVLVTFTFTAGAVPLRR